jgi:hypothetical protein
MEETTSANISRTISLISSDGHRMAVPVELARYSKTISAALEANDVIAAFQFPPGIATGAILDEIVRYMKYRKEYEGRLDAPKYDIPENVVRDLTLAADYLDI